MSEPQVQEETKSQRVLYEGVEYELPEGIGDEEVLSFLDGLGKDTGESGGNIPTLQEVLAQAEGADPADLNNFLGSPDTEEFTSSVADSIVKWGSEKGLPPHVTGALAAGAKLLVDPLNLLPGGAGMGMVKRVDDVVDIGKQVDKVEVVQEAPKLEIIPGGKANIGDEFLDEKGLLHRQTKKGLELVEPELVDQVPAGFGRTDVYKGAVQVSDKDLLGISKEQAFEIWKRGVPDVMDPSGSGIVAAKQGLIHSNHQQALSKYLDSEDIRLLDTVDSPFVGFFDPKTGMHFTREQFTEIMEKGTGLLSTRIAGAIPGAESMNQAAIKEWFALNKNKLTEENLEALSEVTHKIPKQSMFDLLTFGDPSTLSEAQFKIYERAVETFGRDNLTELLALLFE